MRIPWTKQVSKKEENGKRKNISIQSSKRQLTLLEPIMKKEGLVNLTLTGHIKSKWNRGKQEASYWMSLCEWMEKLGTEILAKEEKLLRVRNNRKVWTAIIAHKIRRYVTHRHSRRYIKYGVCNFDYFFLLHFIFSEVCKE